MSYARLATDSLDNIFKLAQWGDGKRRGGSGLVEGIARYPQRVRSRPVTASFILSEEDRGVFECMRDSLGPRNVPKAITIFVEFLAIGGGLVGVPLRRLFDALDIFSEPHYFQICLRQVESSGTRCRRMFTHVQPSAYCPTAYNRVLKRKDTIANSSGSVPGTCGERPEEGVRSLELHRPPESETIRIRSAVISTCARQYANCNAVASVRSVARAIFRA